MGAGKPEQKYGVRNFKKGFGGNKISPGRFEKLNYKYLFKIIMLFYNKFDFRK